MEIQEIKKIMYSGKLYYCDNETLANEQLKSL